MQYHLIQLTEWIFKNFTKSGAEVTSFLFSVSFCSMGPPQVRLTWSSIDVAWFWYSMSKVESRWSTTLVVASNLPFQSWPDLPMNRGRRTGLPQYQMSWNWEIKTIVDEEGKLHLKIIDSQKESSHSALDVGARAHVWVNGTWNLQLLTH